MELPSIARPLFTASLLTAITAGATACGGEDRGRPQPPADGVVEPVDYCAIESQLELQPIVHFEQSTGNPCDASITALPPAGQGVSCGTYVNYDLVNSLQPGSEPLARCTTGAGRPDAFVTFPSFTGFTVPGSALPRFELPEPRCDAEAEVDERAFRLQAENVSMCFGETTGRLGWGAGVEVTLNSTLDASEWEGIAFWIRKGPGASEPTLLFTVSDVNTTGTSGMSGLPGAGQPCDIDETAPDTSKCDAFGVTLTLSDEWQFTRVRFDAMRQKGFGRVSSKPTLEPAGLRRIQFLLTAGTWDFWIDDVSFYRTRATAE